MDRKANMMVACLLALTLGGCVSNPDHVPVVWEPVRAFEARFEGKGQVISLHLGNVKLIRSPSLGWEPAYPLKVDGPGPLDRIIWLDVKQNVVRIDQECGAYPDPSPLDGCQYQIVSWEDRGAFPPLGIGWPGHTEGGGIHYFLARAPYFLPFERLRMEENLVMVSIAAQPIEPHDQWLRAVKAAEYLPGDPIPSKIVLTHNDENITLFRTQHSILHNLSPSPPSVPREIPQMDAWSGVVHPGEEGSITNDSVSVLDAIEGLTESSQRAKSSFDDGGCIQAYHLIPGRDGRHQEALGIKRYTYLFEVVSPKNDGLTVVVDREDTPIGTEWVDPEERDLDRVSPCSDRPKMPAPTVRYQDFQNLLMELPVSGDLMAQMFFTTPFKYGERWEATDQSRIRYEARYRPEWLETDPGTRSYFPYAVAFDAAGAEFLHLMIAPQDVIALDTAQEDNGARQRQQ